MIDSLAEANKIKDWLADIRRDFHRHPELGLEEFRTRGKIIQYLKEMGITHIKEAAYTGVVALIEGKGPGKTVALRADMDGLPMEDLKKVEYRSTVKGKMHACGHDGHMAVLLGTAKILSNYCHYFNGNVKLFFQPAEESHGGAEQMIKEGVMENPKVDAVFGLHMAPEIPTGQIGIKYGQMNASSDGIKLVIKGHSTHGAYPQSGIDAIVITGYIITALQTIVSRNIDPRDSAVVTLGTIHGGMKSNIIADEVEIQGTVRTLDPYIRSQIINRIETLAKQIAESLGGRCSFFSRRGYMALINHDTMVDIVKENGEKILGVEGVKIIEKPSLGVEDFSYFVHHCPGAFFRLGCRNEEKGIIYDGHSHYFDIDEDCLPFGVAMQVENALSVLRE